MVASTGLAPWTIEWLEFALLDATQEQLKVFGRAQFHAVHPTLRYCCNQLGDTMLHLCLQSNPNMAGGTKFVGGIFSRVDVLRDVLLPPRDDMVRPLWFPRNKAGACIFIYLSLFLHDGTIEEGRPLVQVLFDGICKALAVYARNYSDLLYPFIERVYGLESPTRYNPWSVLTAANYQRLEEHLLEELRSSSTCHATGVTRLTDMVQIKEYFNN